MTPDLDAVRAMVEGAKPCAWLTDSVARWLEEYDGPACGRMTAVHRKPLKNGTGMAVYRATDYDALAAEVEANRATIAALEARLEALTGDRLFIVGANHGWDEAMEQVAAEARRYASFYPQGSDGMNTFVLLAEWAESTTRAALSQKDTPDAPAV